MKKNILGYGVSIGDNNGHCLFLYNRGKKELYATDQIVIEDLIPSKTEAKKIAGKETSERYLLVEVTGTYEGDAHCKLVFE